MELDCIVCKVDGTGEESIGCDHCDGWVHFSCAKVDKSTAERILNFFCNDCTSPDRITVWRRVERNPEQLAEKPFYYDVNRIRGHRTVDSAREFLVSWKPTGRGSIRKTHLPSWEPEHHLDGAIDLLQQYCRDNSLPYSEIEGLMGANKDNEEARIQNWVTMPMILTTLGKLLLWEKVETTLDPVQWTGTFGNKDQLFFLKHGPHCFVLLYISSKELAYIADGSNVFRKDSNTAKEIQDLLDIRLVSLPFEQQLKIDYCGSSAVLIAFELVKLYSDRVTYRKLTTAKSRRAQVAKLLHKSESKSAVGRLAVTEQRVKCEVCGKTFRQKQRANLKRHMFNSHKIN